MALRETIIERKAKTGSVGAVWPPTYDGHNNRVKGFCPYIISNRLLGTAMLRQVMDARKRSNSHSRTTIRAFAEKGLLDGMAEEIRENNMGIEAKFDAGNTIRGCELVYIGGNSRERMPDPMILEQELQSVRSMDHLRPVSYREAMERVRKSGHTVSKLEQATQADIEDLLGLYNEAYQKYTFEITEQSVRDMLNNGNVVIVGRYAGTRIVSALIAEHCELLMEGGKIRADLFELSDYATRKEHRGNGLITVMQMEVIKAIRAMRKGYESIIYAEDRAAWIPVNRSSKKAGMEYCGTLPKHCLLESDRSFQETGDYENLNVWFHRPGE